jgi:hypothetical protein
VLPDPTEGLEVDNCNDDTALKSSIKSINELVRSISANGKLGSASVTIPLVILVKSSGDENTHEMVLTPVTAVMVAPGQ